MAARRLSLLLALLMAATPLAAEAGGKRYHGGHGGYHGGYSRHYYKYDKHGHHGDYDSGDVALAFGVGAVVGLLAGWLSAAPRAAPVYMTPRAVTCIQDDVWRVLPDGRVQTGIRTRCY